MARIKLAADLHIHSCLSPCGDMAMTPNNLVNMAYLKGLEAIAVCDHNSTKNLPACKAVADARGLIFVPGMEVETKEEVHVLCLFPVLEQAMAMGNWVYERLPGVPNRPDFFGEQIAMNEDDEPIYTEPKLLIQATDAGIDEVAGMCRRLGGVPVPAHINRTSNALLENLGFVPPELCFTSVEVYAPLPVMGVDLERYHVVYNSDAHNLESISEKEHFVSAYEKSPAGILRYLAEEKSI
ncbi:MAG: hypothetical protein PHO41_00565 [Eubacteriales bacterium]|nr:hypothetical protein [Eubacteriales bacterium]